ncbi:tetratricopeptide repeat protein [Paracidobacterium acidisoli]|uniref:Tetratricopeptide repeat protein n=1 Tax=Paracidobacterium acidisoli TaxID=2303751 RepID=A0A372IJ40_9BACT|nr:tetratricopeptide repeat protein [Paracidobacterium acidisoli]MBT9333229.1 tetratricopeptide repeat protein [Paracidobacterium acidisoli]
MVFATLCSGTAMGADTRPPDSLWRTYFEAAIDTIEASQDASEAATKLSLDQNAVVLLQSALDVANRIDPDGPRPRITNWLIYITYYELNRGEEAEKLIANSKAVALKLYKADLMPVAKKLDQLGNTYLNHDTDTKNYNTLNENFAAYKCYQAEVGILMNTYGESDVQLATPTSSMAIAEMRLGTGYMAEAADQPKDKEADRKSNEKSADLYLTDAIQQYKNALAMWAESSRQNEVLRVNSQRYMVSRFELPAAASRDPGATAGGGGIEGPNNITSLLSDTEVDLGDLYVATDQKDKAQKQYQEAAEVLSSVLTTYQADWPNHPNIAFAQNRLGLIYLKENRYPDAEKEFRVALQATEQSVGKSAANTKTLAQNLGYTLRLEHREAEAKVIDDQYGVKSN